MACVCSSRSGHELHPVRAALDTDCHLDAFGGKRALQTDAAEIARDGGVVDAWSITALEMVGACRYARASSSGAVLESKMLYGTQFGSADRRIVPRSAGRNIGRNRIVIVVHKRRHGGPALHRAVPGVGDRVDRPLTAHQNESVQRAAREVALRILRAGVVISSSPRWHRGFPRHRGTRCYGRCPGGHRPQRCGGR